MKRLAIHSDRAVLPSGISEATVVIENGIISSVQHGMFKNFDGEMIDVKGSVLMPGIIDPHVHINEPGRTDWEGFDTATKAAIAGGITTMVDMPLNSSPVTTTINAFDEKLSAAKNKLHTNVGFWGGVVPGNSNKIEPLIQQGVLGFKAFLIHSGIDEFPNVNEEELDQAMPVIAKYDLPLLVHCELSDDSADKMNDPRSYQQYLRSRPRRWENDAIDMMIRLCEKHRCRTHIVHLSSSDAITAIVAAKQKGLPLTVETGQHYLYFNAEDIPNGQTQYKCAPPIRERENNDLLWKALAENVIDFVATDHSPATPSLKEMESGDLMKAWGGISSIQFALPVLWTVARKRGFSVYDICQWLCERPAAFIGKAGSKGKIATGYDADLVVWDSNASFTITEDIIRHKHKVTPYLGKQLYGVTEQTWLKGDKVFDKGEMILNKGEIMLR
jgi:allantoinase